MKLSEKELSEQIADLEKIRDFLGKRLKTECDERDNLQKWLGAIATLVKEDAGETPEIIYEAVDEKIKGIFADWYVETQDRDMYEHELNEKLKSAESELKKIAVYLGDVQPTVNAEFVIEFIKRMEAELEETKTRKYTLYEESETARETNASKAIEYLKRAESAEAKLESFTMRFGSYGTFTHTDILKKIDEQEAEVKRLRELPSTVSLEAGVRLGKRVAELDVDNINLKDRLAKAQGIYRTMICKTCIRSDRPCICDVLAQRFEEVLGGSSPSALKER